MSSLKHIFCPECLDFHDFSEVMSKEKFQVKTEDIEINARYLKCSECGELIIDPDNPDENLIKAYDEYRKIKNLLMPNEIIDIRRKYDLSQRQMAKILGWSHATLSKYETGAIQSVSHNNELVLLNNPENMIKILERNKSNLTESEFSKIKNKIVSLINDEKDSNLSRMMISAFEHNPSEYSGYKKFNLEKLIETIKYFAMNDKKLYKVKLFKSLWYSDFLHFKRYTVALNGLTYVNYRMGPVPEEYDLLISLVLRESEDLEKEYIDFGYPNPGELFISKKEFDPTLFSEEELKTLEDVCNFLSNHNSKSVSELSHKEKAWIETENNEKISYTFATELSLQ